MKNLKILIVLLITIAGFTATSEVKAQSFDISFSTFQRDLSPYGRWYNHPRYGQVWSYNQPGFRPYYSDGHWEYTDYGWEWISDYDWGWAPFHYGRWEYDQFDGWIWIPGYEWAPAWVSWSSYDNYYGWAPLGYGLSVNISFGSIPYDRWCFVPRQNIYERNLTRYYVSPQRNNGFRNATIINNVYNGRGGRGNDGRFYRGPDRNDVQRYTRTTIPQRTVDNREKVGLIKVLGDRHDNQNRQNNNTTNTQNNNNNNNAQWRSNDRQSSNATDRTNQAPQNQGNNNKRDILPWRQQQNDQQQRQQADQQQRQQQIDQQQKQQQIDQQQKQQQMEQQRRQQQVDQQQKQQQVEQQRRQQQNDQQQKQQQMEQQKRQQQMDQQRRQQDQQRQQQDNQRKQPVYQTPPIKEERKQENNQRSNDNGNKGGVQGVLGRKGN